MFVVMYEEMHHNFNLT